MSLGWLCHKMILSCLGVIQIYYFQNGPNATVTSQIISTPNFIALY